MNLLDMANFVCAKVRHTEAEDVAACKQFIRQRYEVIYNDALWKHSMMQLDVAVNPLANQYGALDGAGIDTSCHRDGVVLLPSIVDRVVAIRTSDRVIDVGDVLDWFRVDVDEFALTGRPLNFIEQPRVVWCPWQTTNPVYQRAVSCSYNDALVPTDTGTVVKVRLVDENWVRKNFDLTMSPGANDPFVSGIIKHIESFTKPPTTSSIILLASDTIIATLQPSETEFRPLARVRLMPTPTEVLTIKVLFKMRHVPLAEDNESPALLNLDNVLLALAHGDMLERERQYAKAGVKFQEGLALLEQFKRIETVQQAHRQRLLPEGDNEGYAIELPSKGYW